MDIKFLGATKTVTGSRYLLSINEKKILIDCGLYQGYKELRLRNWAPLPVDPRLIDAVILTHAHIDHSGYLPLLVKNGFSGKIYCTHGTRELCSILLPDSGHIQEEDADRANRYGYTKHKPALPLYTRVDAIRSMEQFYSVDFDKPVEVVKGLSFRFYPAGHIIGSAIVKLEHEETSVVFTGDLGRPHHLVMRAPTPISTADYLIVESTYGDRLHDNSSPLDQMAEVIEQTIAGGGSVIIPAFAVGRTQEILYLIYQLKKARRIPDMPVFLDSPMAQEVSDLMIHYANEHRLSREICKAVCASAKYTITTDESKHIDQYTHPIIIVSASGMAEGGRILHHLKKFLPDERNTILFTGYQDPGTRGDRLTRGEPEIKIHGEMVPVRAHIVAMSNMSAHADYQEMLGWLSNFKSAPRKVFITHGNQASAESLKAKIEEKFGWNCYIPDYLQTVQLEENTH